MTDSRRGFTLIEIMIVFVILGLLATVAVTMYQRYRIETTIAEVSLMAGRALRTMQECMQVNLKLDSCSNTANADVKTAYDNVLALSSVKSGVFDFLPNHSATWQLIHVELMVAIPGEKDASGNPLEAEYVFELWLNKQDGSIETYNPGGWSECVILGYCQEAKYIGAAQ